MAKLRTLEKGAQNVRVHASEVDCTYQVVTGDDGRTYLHLSTFGSDKRKSHPKVSQTIQLDQTIAAKLLEVIKNTFPGIGN